jgi:hypothetical protein
VEINLPPALSSQLSRVALAKGTFRDVILDAVHLHRALMFIIDVDVDTKSGPDRENFQFWIGSLTLIYLCVYIYINDEHQRTM